MGLRRAISTGGYPNLWQGSARENSVSWTTASVPQFLKTLPGFSVHALYWVFTCLLFWHLWMWDLAAGFAGSGLRFLFSSWRFSPELFVLPFHPSVITALGLSYGQ